MPVKLYSGSKLSKKEESLTAVMADKGSVPEASTLKMASGLVNQPLQPGRLLPFEYDLIL
jgi:hypothetical protein